MIITMALLTQMNVTFAQWYKNDTHTKLHEILQYT